MPFPEVTLYPSESLFPGSEPPKSEGFGENEFPIIITDEFNYKNGRWFHYYAAPTMQRGALRNQRHVNIRSFVNEQREIPVNMFIMDQFKMFDLDGETIAHFSSNAEARIFAESNEAWTFGAVGRQSDRNNWNGIKVECEPNVTTPTQSVIPV